MFDVGVVGINLEDGREPPTVLAKKIEVARAVAQRARVDVFINARTDVYLKNLTAVEKRVDEVAARAALYASAGCDGLFVPKVVDRAELAAVVASTALPVNVLAVPGLPRPDVLRELGVRRLSVGQAMFQVALAAARRAAHDLLRDGDYARMFEEAIPFAEMDALVRARMAP